MHIMEFHKNAFESLEQNKDFILAHDVTDIPMHYLINIGMCCNQRDYLAGDASTPYRSQEYLVENLKKCREVRCVLSALTFDNVKYLANAIETKVDVEIILTNRALQALRIHYFHIIKIIAGSDNLKIYRIKEANLNLWVTESNLFLGLFRIDGCYDLEKVIICDNEKGMEWGNMLFEHYRRKAEAVGNSSIQF
jgi:predicted transcriptional regulator